MAASSVARRMAGFLSVAFLIGSGIMASAQSVAPSNATLPSGESSAENQVKLTGGGLIDAKIYTIAPLTTAVGEEQSSTAVGQVIFNGQAILADASSTNISSSDIAVVSCDPNGGNIDQSAVVGNIGNAPPKAIILYSLTSQSCTLNGSYTFPSIFSMISQSDSLNLVAILSNMGGISAAIAPNTTSGTQTSQNSDEGAPAPTTAVAMSILYSITGIITLLFLVIIATGAVRAHRHPERYGPRSGVQGRPRQSRAKGLARAMLETLPIVKFGDPEPVKLGSQDVELESGQAHVHSSHEAVATSGFSANEDTVKSPNVTTAAPVLESGMGAAQAESVNSGEEATTKEGELGCSICTEDFTTGEDVRVLPCNHKYHPACIDPWLLNVSGTCPLCRHDLRPVTSATSHTEDTAITGATDELPPPLSINEGTEGHSTEATGDSLEGDASQHQRRRISRFLDLHRLRHAPPDERIAALRSLREESQRDTDAAATPAEDTEERTRRARLTGRLRDTFRIRTRAENLPNTSSSS